jgi:hypothetical protein
MNSRSRAKTWVKVMLLVNEDHEIYDRQMVGYIIHHLLGRCTVNGSALYPHLDAVVFVTERHATTTNCQIAYPVYAKRRRALNLPFG